MKRLVMILLVALMTATTFAQGKDIVGNWVLDAEKTGSTKAPPALAITVSAADIKVSMGTADHMQALTFKRDGSSMPIDHGGTGTAKLTNTRLEATITSDHGASTATFSREGNWLVQEVKDAQHAMKA